MKTKLKKIIFLILLCMIIYGIYTLTKTDKINYLALGDSLSLGIDSNGNTNYGYSNVIANYLKKKYKINQYTNEFSKSGARINDLLYNIETNQTININNESLSLKKCLRESDLVTLSIGGNDLLSKITLSTTTVETLDDDEIIKIIDETLKDLDKLLKELRKYAKEDIILLGYYNPYNNNYTNMDRLFAYLNTKTTNLCEKYDIEYIELYILFKNNKNYLPNPTNIHPSTEGYQAIANKIIKNLLI